MKEKPPSIDCVHIFSNIQDIRDLHVEFLKELDTKIIDWSAEQTIGDSFRTLVCYSVLLRY